MVYRFLMVATPILFPAFAEAQVQTGTTAPSLLIPLEPPQVLPASVTTGGYFFNLRPVGADLGRSLADDGIYIVARDLSEELGDVSGGVERGASFEGYTSLGFDLDLARIAALKGGTVHFLISDLQGEPFFGYSGSAYLTTGFSPGMARACISTSSPTSRACSTSGSTCVWAGFPPTRSSTDPNSIAHSSPVSAGLPPLYV